MFVWIEPGTFVMGTTEEQEQLLRDKKWWRYGGDEQPAHEVTISQGFWMGIYEITQAQWETVMGSNSNADTPNEGANRPVMVSWEDVQEFIRRLNEATGEELYRLPTEAEWEYTCRAGTTTLWSFGNDERQLESYAWYGNDEWLVDLNVWSSSPTPGYEGPKNVGTKLPNPWGLYDMYGNVEEWCQDWYGWYTSESQVDPTGPTFGSSRVVRGGNFIYGAQIVRSTSRSKASPSPFSPRGVGGRLLRMRSAPTAVTSQIRGEGSSGGVGDAKRTIFSVS